MRTLLINPPYPLSEFPAIPMGLAYIAGVLEKEGKEIQVQDFLVNRYSVEKLKRKIAEYEPQIVGITSVTLNYPVASRILKDCKKANKNIVTVIGGPHVSFTPEETLREAPWIDIVVIGEGERTMLDIVNGKGLHQINGIAFRKNGEITLTDPRSFIENLDELPFPGRHLFPLAKYLALYNECGLITSRGCPFNCIFCVGHKMVGKRARLRNPKLVVDEIEDILSKGFKTINFVDDLFTINHRHVHAVCDEILRRNLKFKWTAFSRVDTVNPGLLAKMREAGCSFLLYGVESGNQQILDIAKKKITPQKVKAGVEMARAAGIKTFASFIIGLPGETKETLKQTVKFAKELDTYYGFHLLSPFPGTEVRNRAEELGLKILTNDWEKYNANEPITETKYAKACDLSKIDKAYKKEIDLYAKCQERWAKEGSLSQAELEEMASRKRSQFVAKLLEKELIENLGKMKTNGDIIGELERKIARRLSFPLSNIKEALEDMVGRGLLRYENHDGKITWRWS